MSKTLQAPCETLAKSKQSQQLQTGNTTNLAAPNRLWHLHSAYSIHVGHAQAVSDGQRNLHHILATLGARGLDTDAYRLILTLAKIMIGIPQSSVQLMLKLLDKGCADSGHPQDLALLRKPHSGLEAVAHKVVHHRQRDARGKRRTFSITLGHLYGLTLAVTGRSGTWTKPIHCRVTWLGSLAPVSSGKCVGLALLQSLRLVGLAQLHVGACSGSF